MARLDNQFRLRRITLAFVDPNEETAYTRYSVARSLGPIRWAAVSGLLVLLLFGYLDVWIFPSHYLKIWMGRGLCALYIVSSLLLTYTSYYRRFLQPVTALGTVLCAVLAVWMMYLTRGNPFSGDLSVGILICVIFSCMFLRLPFPWAAGSSLAMLVLFLLFADGSVAGPKAFFIKAVYLSLGTISSILGAYSIEVHLRHSYWQTQQLQQADQQHQRLLHSILPPAIAVR